MRGRITKTILCLFLFQTVCQATPIITNFYEDGTIQNGDIYEIVKVWGTAAVDMIGGQVDQLNTYESSTITFSAGTVGEGVSIQNTSKFYLEGNLTLSSYYPFGISHSAEFYINSGTFDGEIISGASGKIIVNDGSVSVGESVITDSGNMNIYGGAVTFADDILFDRYAVLNIYGGDVKFNGNSFGNAFRLSSWASFNVYYSDIIYGPGTEIIGYYLLDGSEFMLDQFNQSEIDQINLVPEPATFLLLGLGSFVLRKKRS